jgi:hypothetical protein
MFTTAILRKADVFNPVKILEKIISAITSYIRGILPAIFILVCILSLIASVVFYVFQTKSVALQETRIKSLEVGLQSLLKENLALQGTQKENSLKKAIALAKNLNYVEAGQIRYINADNVSPIVSR